MGNVITHNLRADSRTVLVARLVTCLITQERIGVGASNLVGIIDVGVDACGILSRSNKLEVEI